MPIDIIQNAIPRSLCQAAEAAWPDQYWPFWHRYNGTTANKFGSMDRFRIPAACIAALDALALAVSDRVGESFIDYDLHAAGMHMIPPGGFLANHLDAESHPTRLWTRTHSIVLFVNATWDSKRFGGELVIGTPRGDYIVEPKQGQAVIFETNGAWHRVNAVTDCQSTCCNPWRKTLALFAWNDQYIPGGSIGARFDEGIPSAS